MQLLNGIDLKNEIQEKLKEKVLKISELKPVPTLVIIQVGSHPESNIYIRQKIGFGKVIGVNVNHLKLAENIGEKELGAFVKEASADPTVHGVIIQLPLPKHINKDSIFDVIDPAKDVDGMTPINIKKLWAGDQSAMIAPTARGIGELLQKYNVDVEGKHVVIVGKSTLVGKPIFALMLEKGATCTVCHSKTRDLKKYTREADILISVVGKPALITHEHVKEGQIVIDVGLSVVETGGNRRLYGDIDFEHIKERVAMITPVPGGIGPLTVACIFENLLDAYKTQVMI